MLGATSTVDALVQAPRRPESQILHFLFEFQAEALPNAGFQLGGQFAKLARGAPSGVVDQVGVVVRHVDSAFGSP